MVTLSEEEFEKMDRELDDDARIVLKFLAEIREKNPRNPWVSANTLGAQIGGVTGKTQANLAITRLHLMGLIGYYNWNQNNVAISNNGLAYVNFIQKTEIVSHNKKYYLLLAFFTILGVIISISTGQVLYFILGILTSIIAGIIIFVITRPKTSKDQ